MNPWTSSSKIESMSHSSSRRVCSDRIKTTPWTYLVWRTTAALCRTVPLTRTHSITHLQQPFIKSAKVFRSRLQHNSLPNLLKHRNRWMVPPQEAVRPRNQILLTLRLRSWDSPSRSLWHSRLSNSVRRRDSQMSLNNKYSQRCPTNMKAHRLQELLET